MLEEWPLSWTSVYFPVEPLYKARSSVSADTFVGLLNKTCAIWHCLLGLPWRMGEGTYCWRADSHERLNLAYQGAEWSTGKCRSLSHFVTFLILREPWPKDPAHPALIAVPVVYIALRQGKTKSPNLCSLYMHYLITDVYDLKIKWEGIFKTS